MPFTKYYEHRTASLSLEAGPRRPDTARSHPPIQQPEVVGTTPSRGEFVPTVNTKVLGIEPVPSEDQSPEWQSFIGAQEALLFHTVCTGIGTSEIH